MFVCLFVFPIRTREPLDRFASNFDLGMFLTRIELTFTVKLPGKIVQVRVKGGSNYEQQGQRRDPKLVFYKTIVFNISPGHVVINFILDVL